MNALRTWIIGPVAVLATVSLAAAQQPPREASPRPLPPGVRALRELPYIPGGHERNRLDLYLPEKAEGPAPVIVWIHGGAWLGGSKENCPAVPLVGRGYAVASINYRLSQHAVFPAQIEDCKAAIRWLRANAARYSLDADHIGVWGASAGGHLVAMLGTTGGVKELEGSGGNADQSSRVQCVVDWFGPSDLLTMGGSHDNPGSPEARLIGGPVRASQEKARRASPVTYVGKDSAPFLIMHGDQDNVVPLSQSEELAAALRKAGVEVNLQVLKWAGHGGQEFGSPANRKLIEDFFGRHLRPFTTGEKPRKQAKPVLVTISRETTWITEPLREDGYVDYVAAQDARFREGVTSENNAAVPFLRAMWPCHINEEHRNEYCMRLGILG